MTEFTHQNKCNECTVQMSNGKCIKECKNCHIQLGSKCIGKCFVTRYNFKNLQYLTKYQYSFNLIKIICRSIFKNNNTINNNKNTNIIHLIINYSLSQTSQLNHFITQQMYVICRKCHYKNDNNKRLKNIIKNQINHTLPIKTSNTSDNPNSICNLLQIIDSMDIRTLIFIFSGNFWLNLFQMKCSNDKDTLQWLNEKQHILYRRKQSQFNYKTMNVKANTLIGSSFKSITLLDETEENKCIFIRMNACQGKDTRQHEIELINAYNMFEKYAKNKLYAFVHYCKGCPCHGTRIHDNWKTLKDIKKNFCDEIYTELTVEKIIPLSIINVKCWYLKMNLNHQKDKTKSRDLYVIYYGSKRKFKRMK
eukprot:549928_1